VQSLDRDEVTTHVEAPPDGVYALVADVTRTPEFSPEVLRCSWLDGATSAAAGARFEAVNRARRGPAWKNRPVVLVAEPGREFAFSRTEKLSGTVVWRYRLARDGRGESLMSTGSSTRMLRTRSESPPADTTTESERPDLTAAGPGGSSPTMADRATL
jgi:hypothetical protein